jgi:hypothetical protein
LQDGYKSWFDAGEDGEVGGLPVIQPGGAFEAPRERK